MSERPVKVWDLPTRLFHWLVVLGVVLAFVSQRWGDIGLVWHRWNGYALLTLVLFRIAWGVVGSSTARFRAFVRSPWAALAYLRTVLAGRPEPHVGHNPAGAWMVVALLTLLLVQGLTGLFASEDILDITGPLAHLVSSKTQSLLSSIHSNGYYLLMAVACIHIGVILVYRLLLRDDLVTPMITGEKQPEQLPPVVQVEHAPPARALICLLTAAGSLAGVVALARLF